jgi:hypothetical protein
VSDFRKDLDCGRGVHGFAIGEVSEDSAFGNSSAFGNLSDCRVVSLVHEIKERLDDRGSASFGAHAAPVAECFGSLGIALGDDGEETIESWVGPLLH